MAAITSSDVSSPVGSPTAPLSNNLTWHGSAPPAVVEAGARSEEGWRAWRKHLGRRKRPLPLAKLLPGNVDPLRWGLPPADLPSAATPGRLDLGVNPAELSAICRARRADQERLADELALWLSEAPAPPWQPGHALLCLAWCHALPRLAKSLPTDLWWDLADYLVGVAQSAPSQDFTDPLTHQLLAGELPLTLAYLLPEIDNCRTLAEGAFDTLTAGCKDLLGAEGMLAVRHLSRARPLLACWTRSRWLLRELDETITTADGQPLGMPGSVIATRRYTKFLFNLLRLARRDGSQVFDEDGENGEAIELFRAAAKLTGDRALGQLVQHLLLPGGKAPDGYLPSASVEAETAALAYLRTDWSRSAPRLAVAHADRRLLSEFAVGPCVLWSGESAPNVQLNGQTLVPEAEWEECCWETNKHVHYVELEMKLSQGAVVQRQLLLARRDGFLFMADAVIASEPSRLDYRYTLPLAADIVFDADEESCEGVLRDAKRRALVLPLALPEWRQEARHGSLRYDADGLELSLSQSPARALYAPLFLDLDASRRRKPFTWRRLTVGEERQIVPADRAVGYRVQIGREQWLIYRSLTGEGIGRTVLSHHTSFEFVIGRFTTKADFKSMLEV